MPRITNAPASRKRRNRRLKQARGFMGGRHRLYRTATEAVDKAMATATAHRRKKKNDFRGLWIMRLSAACAQQDISYSHFINGLKKSDIQLNRKMLSEIAIHDPDGFAAIASEAKTQLH